MPGYQQSVADHFGVSQTLISAIRRGITRSLG
jgi:hypothetical protein